VFRRQALHLYRSAADALVPALTGEPETWATVDLGKGVLPVRETCQGECVFAFLTRVWSLIVCAIPPRPYLSIDLSIYIRGTSYDTSGDIGYQVATLVNNMANVCAGTASFSASTQHHRTRTSSGPGTMGRDGPGSDGIAAARASQPLPDARRARQLVLAAARLVEVVSESSEARLSRRLGADTNSASSLRRDVVPECELARLVAAFNIGMLSEVSILPILMTLLYFICLWVNASHNADTW
jgi:hypothetical protein